MSGIRELFRLGTRKIVTGLLILGVGVAGYVSWDRWGVEGLVAVTFVAVVLGLAGVGYLLATSERRVRGEVGYFAYSTRDFMETLDARAEQPGEHAEALLRAINSLYRRMEIELVAAIVDELGDTRDSAAMRKTLTKGLAAEVDALLQVHELAGLKGHRPLMGGWALSPRGMLQAMILASRPGTGLVVECGSGTSTLYLARTLQISGQGGKVIALEHLPEYADLTRAALEEHGVDGIAEVRMAPLEEVTVDGEIYRWYAPEAIEDLADVDLLLVDGPPRGTGRRARYPALPLLRGRLRPSATILVDDATRDDEREIVDSWIADFGLFESPGLDSDQAVLRFEGGQ